MVAAINFEAVTENRAEMLRQVLWTLHHDGPFEDENGSAGALLHAALQGRGMEFSASYVNSMLKDLESVRFGKQLIRRDINGKRCYSIALLAATTDEGFPSDPFDEGDEASEEYPDDMFAEELDPEGETEGEVEDVPVIETQPVTSMALEPVATDDEGRRDESAQDLVLYAISMLSDAVNMMVVRQSVDVAGLLDQHLPSLLEQIETERRRAERAERRAEAAEAALASERRNRAVFDRTKLFSGARG